MEYEENLNESQISKPSEIKKRKTFGQIKIYIICSTLILQLTLKNSNSTWIWTSSHINFVTIFWFNTMLCIWSQFTSSICRNDRQYSKSKFFGNIAIFA